GKLVFTLSIYRAHLALTRTGYEWKPKSKYKKFEDDELFYLITLHETAQNYGLTEMSTIEAYGKNKDNIKSIASENTKSDSNRGNDLETLTFLALLTASHANGVSGINLGDF